MPSCASGQERDVTVRRLTIRWEGSARDLKIVEHLGSSTCGNPVVPYAGSEVAFNNRLLDSAGTGFRLKATSPGIAPATSPVFTVGPECPGIPYSIGMVVSGTLTTESCRSNTNEYYVRYTVSAPGTQLISAIPPSPARWGVVFRDGTRAGAQTDTTPHLASGNYSIRIYSGPNGELGNYQLRSKFAFLTKITETPSAVWTCWRIQAHVGIEYSEELRCGGGGVLHACGATGLTNTMGSLFRLWLQANASATITASSGQIDPCIEVTTGDVPAQQIAIDDNSGGGTTARVVLPPSPNGRNVIIIVSGRPPIPASSLFTIKIER